jgi:hypothetical protein
MKGRGNITGGVILIMLGLLFLANQFFPKAFEEFTGPLIIAGIGLIFLVAAVLSRVGPLAIPGCILLGIGGILYFQQAANDFSTWSYMWALIPGFVGVGTLISDLLSPLPHRRSGGWGLIVISLVAFAIFGSAFGLQGNLQKYWPVLLIVLGLIVLARAIFGSRRPVE